jgi:hypothetical protein
LITGRCRVSGYTRFRLSLPRNPSF